MKKVFTFLLIMCFGIITLQSQNTCTWTEDAGKNEQENLLDLLQCLADGESHALLKRHFQSVKMVMDKSDADFSYDATKLTEVYEYFQGDGQLLSTYLNVTFRPFVMAFTSPTDGVDSYYLLTVPKSWNESATDYPMYLSLHGSGGGSNNNPLKIMFNALDASPGGIASQYIGDGYTIYPWGRGDKSYTGVAETDIWECLDDFDAMYTTNDKRQYMSGFSMGGGGTWKLAHQDTARFAAIGLFSPATSPTQEIANKYSNVPAWICWGEDETSIKTWSMNMRDMLTTAGDTIEWHEMPGVGHTYLWDYQMDMMEFFQLHPKGWLDNNKPPSMHPVADQDLIEAGLGTQSISLTGIDDGDGGTQTLDFIITTSPSSIINNATVDYTSGSTGTFNYDPIAVGDVTVTIKVQDDGGTDEGAVDFREYSFIIHVYDDVNQAPTIDAISNQTTNEDETLTLTLSGIDDGDASETQNLNISASSSNPLFSAPVITYTQGESTATLTFVPTPDIDGTTTITISVEDDGGTTGNNGDVTTQVSFDLDIVYVNDKPTIEDLPATINILKNSVQNEYAFKVSDGDPLQEQSLTVTAVSDNPTLVPNPSIAAISATAEYENKKIDFVPAADETGTATITITVSDNGKKAETLSYSITVNVSETLNSLSSKYSDIQIFPIPMQDELNIQFKKQVDKATIQIIDASGKALLKHTEFSCMETILNTHELPKGTMILTIQINDKETITKQIIK